MDTFINNCLLKLHFMKLLQETAENRAKKKTGIKNEDTVWGLFSKLICSTKIRSCCRMLQPVSLFEKDITTICKAELRKRDNKTNSKLLSAASYIELIKDSSIIQSGSKAVQTYTGWIGFLRGYFAC